MKRGRLALNRQRLAVDRQQLLAGRRSARPAAFFCFGIQDSSAARSAQVGGLEQPLALFSVKMFLCRIYSYFFSAASARISRWLINGMSTEPPVGPLTPSLKSASRPESTQNVSTVRIGPKGGGGLDCCDLSQVGFQRETLDFESVEGGGEHRAQATDHKEHRPQRPSQRSDPTQHAKGRAGDCPGPRKESATRRNVTQWAVQSSLQDLRIWDETSPV